MGRSFGKRVLSYNRDMNIKGITVEEPTDSEDITLWYTDRDIMIDAMIAVVRGSTPSVTWTVRHGTDRSATGTEVLTSGTTTTSATTGSIVTAFTVPHVPRTSFIWLETTAQSGTVDELHLTIHYR